MFGNMGIAIARRLAFALVVMASLTCVAGAETSPRVEFEFGSGLDRANRSLTGVATGFPADTERVWCLSRVVGLEAPTTVTHVWYHDGVTRARVDLKIGSADWRTWSSKLMLPGWRGVWEVKVLDTEGAVLGSATFDLQ